MKDINLTSCFVYNYFVLSFFLLLIIISSFYVTLYPFDMALIFYLYFEHMYTIIIIIIYVYIYINNALLFNII